MKMQCSDLDDLLMEGDAASMQIARRHAASCEACAAQLAAWDDITATARSMRASWPNETLWPRIERSLKSDGRRAPGWRWQVAAALVLLAGLTAIVWTSSRLNRVDSVILRQDALNDVERAEKAHVDAINRLEKLTSDKTDDPSTPLLVSYKEKLMLLDDAIAECQTAIDHNHANAHLRKQLLAMYSEKQRTLQDILREDNRVSHQ